MAASVEYSVARPLMAIDSARKFSRKARICVNRRYMIFKIRDVPLKMKYTCISAVGLIYDTSCYEIPNSFHPGFHTSSLRWVFTREYSIIRSRLGVEKIRMYIAKTASYTHFFYPWVINDLLDLSLKSHNAPDKSLTMHHFVTEMCRHEQNSVIKWCTVGSGTVALWDLRNSSIEKRLGNPRKITGIGRFALGRSPPVRFSSGPAYFQ